MWHGRASCVYVRDSRITGLRLCRAAGKVSVGWTSTRHITIGDEPAGNGHRHGCARRQDCHQLRDRDRRRSGKRYSRPRVTCQLVSPRPPPERPDALRLPGLVPRWSPPSTSGHIMASVPGSRTRAGPGPDPSTRRNAKTRSLPVQGPLTGCQVRNVIPSPALRKHPPDRISSRGEPSD